MEGTDQKQQQQQLPNKMRLKKSAPNEKDLRLPASAFQLNAPLTMEPLTKQPTKCESILSSRQRHLFHPPWPDHHHHQHLCHQILPLSSATSSSSSQNSGSVCSRTTASCHPLTYHHHPHHHPNHHPPRHRFHHHRSPLTTITMSTFSLPSSIQALLHSFLLLPLLLLLLTAVQETSSSTSSSSSSSSSSNVEPYRASANLGESVILRCVFDFPDGFRVPYVIQWEKQGVAIPIYIWYDGYKAHQGEGYEGRVSLTGQASLNLSQVRETDQGFYHCLVKFLNRPPEPIKNGTWVHLDVLAPPTFRIKPPDVIYVKIGESIALPCEAVGTPTPQIVWFKDKRPLQSNANVHILANELRISSIQLNDIGEYRCTARNREGSMSTTTKIIIAGPAVITLPPRNLTKLEGDRVEFVCEAKALPSNVTHRWFHNGVEISHLLWMESRVVVKHGSLLINPSIAEDGGRYTCEVSNGIGLPETAEAWLNIEYPARVVYSPTIQYLPNGLSGIVRCFIQASPPFQLVTWTKDRRPFDPNSTPGVSTLANGSLLFERVSTEHQGRYLCRPYNLHGSAEPSQDMEVLVRDPPVITSKPNDVYVRTVNEEVSMPCDGTGQPKPDIFWRKADGSKLSRERSSLRAGNLTVKLLKKEDHGRYECVVANEIATIVAETLLIVNNTTPHTPTHLSVNASHFSATVHWTPAYNGGYEQSFHINYRISEGAGEDSVLALASAAAAASSAGAGEWKSIRVPPPESTAAFTLYNLQAGTEYEFQVYASNRLGAGLPSPTIRASTKPWQFGEAVYPTDASGATYIPTVQKPSGPKPDAPRNLTLEKMAQGWVLSWLAPANGSVAVAYYRVEFRLSEEKVWQYTDPIQHDTAYLMKNLELNSRYIFRVWAYSILGVGEVSEMIEVSLSGMGDSAQNARAVTFAVIGSVVFFLTTIVLAVCAVRICNKRKRKKIEKSYMMVTCPVNGTAGSYGDSPVPSKHSCPLIVLHCLLTYWHFLFPCCSPHRLLYGRHSADGDGLGHDHDDDHGHGLGWQRSAAAGGGQLRRQHRRHGQQRQQQQQQQWQRERQLPQPDQSPASAVAGRAGASAAAPAGTAGTGGSPFSRLQWCPTGNPFFAGHFRSGNGDGAYGTYGEYAPSVHHDDAYYWRLGEHRPTATAATLQQPAARHHDDPQSRFGTAPPSVWTTATWAGPPSSPPPGTVLHGHGQSAAAEQQFGEQQSDRWLGVGQQQPPVPPPRRRALINDRGTGSMKNSNLLFSLESGLVEGPFLKDARFGKKYQQNQHNYDLPPAESLSHLQGEASVRGSFRSDGSGQSQAFRRPFSQLSFVGSSAAGGAGAVGDNFAVVTKQPPPSFFTRTSLQSASLPLRAAQPQTLLQFQQRQQHSGLSGTSLRSNQGQQQSVGAPSTGQVFRTSSPTTTAGQPSFGGAFSREFSSIDRQQHQPPHLLELPALRPIHDYSLHQRGIHPSSAVSTPFNRAHFGQSGTSAGAGGGNSTSSTLRATVPIHGRSWFHPGASNVVAGSVGGQRSQTLSSRPAPFLEPVPEAIYDSATGAAAAATAAQMAQHSEWERQRMIAREQAAAAAAAAFQPYQNLPAIRRHLLQLSTAPADHQGATSENPPIRRPLPLHPHQQQQSTSTHFHSTLPRSGHDLNTSTNSSSSSSSLAPFEYTRDKLLGAVEKLRSGYQWSQMSRGSPMRHSVEGHHHTTPATTPVKSPPPLQSTVPDHHLHHHHHHHHPQHSQQLPPVSRISAPTYHHQRQHSLPFRPSQYQPPSSYLPRTSSSDHPHHPHHHQQTLSFTSTEPTLLTHDPSSASSGFISGTQSSSVLLRKPPTSFADQTLTSTDDAHFLRHQQLRSSSRTREPFVEPSSYEEEMLGSPFDLDLPQPPPPSSGDPDGADDTAAADIDRLRRESLRWRHWQTWTLRDRNAYLLPPTVATPQPLLPRAVLEQSGAPEVAAVVPLSSSAPTYGSILGGQHYHSYREPRSTAAAGGNGNGSGSMSIEAMEARCAQLRQEFANFRQRQAALEAQRRETRSVISQKAEETASRTGAGGGRSGGGLFEGEGPGGYATIVGGSSSSTSNEFESAC